MSSAIRHKNRKPKPPFCLSSSSSSGQGRTDAHPFAHFANKWVALAVARSSFPSVRNRHFDRSCSRNGLSTTTLKLLKTNPQSNPKSIFFKNTPKIACQAPKQSKQLKTKEIDLAY
jgi:hypothetical protein